MGVLPQIFRAAMQDQCLINIKLGSLVIANLTSGPAHQCESFLKHKVIGVLSHLVKSQNEDVAENCVFALANLASDNDRIRQILVEEKFVDHLLSLAARFEHQTQKLKTAVWALGNICRGKKLANSDELDRTIPFWCKIIC